MTEIVSPTGPVADEHDVSASLVWSIVVITRNEERNIEQCIRSVINAFGARVYEVILVDADSTDRTVEIAKNHAVEIIKIHPGGPFRPSVGRYIGFKHTQAEWVLFLDGDMTLDPTWVAFAEDAFSSDPLLAGVAGEMQHLLPDPNVAGKETTQAYPDNDYVNADYLSGSAAYKRESLRKTGGFNPFMRAYEEAEFGFRLRKSGYQLLRLRIPMTRHAPIFEKETFSELFRRLQRGYFIGAGQLVRHVLHYKLPMDKPLSLIRRYLQFSTLTMFGVITLIISVLKSNWLYFTTWLALLLIIAIAFSIRSGSVKKPLYYFTHWFLASPHVLWGLFMLPKPIEEFSIDVLADCIDPTETNTKHEMG